MRLHRLRLRDFRGIGERDIVFAESGITVVEGANEAGKSSMIEALDLLLRTQATSKGAAVKAVQPAGRDVGSEVFAEISCGPWHFEYFKRFNKKAETALTVLAPRREHLTGRAAHERVEQILAREMDAALFEALRLVQSGAPDLGGLADSAALSRALDRAVTAGTDPNLAGDTGESQVLIDAAAAEYQRYYTLKTGRPARELAEAVATAKAARTEVAERRAALEAAAEAERELPRVAAERRAATDAEVHAVEEHAAALARLVAGQEVIARLEQAREKAQLRRIAADLKQRDADDRRAAEQQLAQLDEQIAADTRVLESQRGTAEHADADAAELEKAVVEALSALAAVRAELAEAEAAEQAAAVRDRLAVIDEVLAEAAALTGRRDRLAAEVEANAAGPQQLSLAQQLDRDIAVAQAALDSVAAAVEVTPRGTGEVRVDGELVSGPTEIAAVGETVIEAPGVRVVVRGAARTREQAEGLDRLRARAAELVALCGVQTLAEVIVRAEARSAARRELREVSTALGRVLGGATPDVLGDERARLTADLPAAPAGVAPRPAAQVRSAERELGELVRRAEQKATARRVEAGAARARAQALDEALERQRTAAAGLRAGLLEQRAACSDEALRGVALSAHEEYSAARSVVAECESAAAGVDPAGLRAAADEAEAQVDRWRRRQIELRDRSTELRTVLELCRTENRLDDLSAAQASADAAAAELARVQARADGARLLYETLVAKQAESRSRYVAPFTRRLEELAAPVFGESVRFEVDDDFTIAHRTLDGVTVPAAELSGGAREQLGLIARLACAMIVDPDDGVPVILDDALGYSDPQRLESMAQVLAAAAGDAQIIVLTCTPDRYAAVPEATVVAV